MSKLLSTTTCYDNDKYIAPTPEIKTNIQLTAIDQLKKYAGVPHGMSMVALTLIDPLNRNLEMNVVFEIKWFKLRELPENLTDHVRVALNQIKKGIVYSEYGFN